jgi:DedD protein
VDRYLKERLVGAAVLVAAATILIPEMLSGPHDSSGVVQESSASSDSTGVKTYTIDLNAPSAQTTRSDQSLPQTFIEPAPPPEPVPSDKALAESQSAAGPTESSIVTRDEQLLDQYRTPSSTPSSSANAKPTALVDKNEPEKPETKTTEKSAEEKAIGNPIEPTHNKNQTKSQGKPVDQPRGSWAVQVASFEARPTSERVAKAFRRL